MRDLNEDDLGLIREAVRKGEVAFIPEHVPPDDSFPEEIPPRWFWDEIGPSGLYEFPGLKEIDDHPLFHPDKIEESWSKSGRTVNCRSTLVSVLNEYEPLTVDEWRRGNKGFSKGDPVYHIKWDKRRKP